jgi:predicted metal-dependent HD superfamily phosphohydrolase
MTFSDQPQGATEIDVAGAAAADRLHPRFQQLWTDLNGHDPAVIYRVLIGFYGQRQRHYHTLAHVEDCFRHLDTFRAAEPAFLPAPMWRAAELALWFHDVIHQPGARDNEERSADFFEAIAVEASFPAPLIAAVRRLILATKINTPSPAAEEQVVIDCDLASLGYEPELFKRSGAAIRREQDFLPEGDFVEARRAAFLRLGERPSIFRTEFMRRRYERQARANLAAALDGL